MALSKVQSSLGYSPPSCSTAIINIPEFIVLLDGCDVIHAETCEEGILVMVVTNIKRSVFIIAIAITSLNQLLLYCCHIVPLAVLR